MATANNADALPPELKRKGRFDEIFCVNLPNEQERESIFKVHVERGKRRKLDIQSSVFKDLLKSTDGFNGADIESVVNEAMEESFLEKKQDLTAQKLLEVAKRTVSISKSCKLQIENMKKRSVRTALKMPPLEYIQVKNNIKNSSACLKYFNLFPSAQNVRMELCLPRKWW